MRKIMTFILFASLANTLACNSGFEKAIPTRLQEVVKPLETPPAPTAENATPGDSANEKDAKKPTIIVPAVKDGEKLSEVLVPITDPNAAPLKPADGKPVEANIVRVIDNAMADRDAGKPVAQVPAVQAAAQSAAAAPNLNTIVPVAPNVPATTTASAPAPAAAQAAAEPAKNTEVKAETNVTKAEAPAVAAPVIQQADIRKFEKAMEERQEKPLEWAFSELRVILPDTLLSTSEVDKQVVIANNALMSNSTAMFRLAGEKSYMLCRAAASPGLTKGDTFTFVSATQKAWPKDKRAMVALLTFENKQTQKGLKFSCLIFGSKTENDFKANMRDIVEFRNHMGLYN